MKPYIIVLYLFLSSSIFSQNYTDAIVTDLNFTRRLSGTINKNSFPFYFQYKDFVRDVQGEIQKLLQEKFGVSKVLFLDPDSIYYVESPVAPKIEAKEFAIATARENTIYVSVETIIQEHSWVNNELVYRFTTRVNVFDNKGKSIFKYKNHIPFVSVYGDYIGGETIMGEQDFYTFYFDGLFNAFEGKYKTITKRYIGRPTASEYAEFVGEANKFYLTTDSSGYSYGSDTENLVKIAEFSTSNRDSQLDYFDFLDIVTRDYLDNGYVFSNILDSSDYTVKLKGGIEGLRKKLSPTADIDFQLLNSKEEHMGYFKCNDDNILTGRYGINTIEIRWKHDYSCSEFYISNELLALTNHFDGQKVLFLSPQINRDQFVALINLMFIYDYSFAIRTRMYIAYYN